MIRELAGDAIVAIGYKIRGGLPNLLTTPDFDDTVKVHEPDYGWHVPFHTGAMESDGPQLAWGINRGEIRSALDELSDSKLLNIAATIIAGWKPLLLSVEAAALTDVDLLVQALRDRAAQFRAVEDDADEPFHPVQLDTLYDSPRRGE